jgi:predicted  nucleic acid-binding Zn-ribbon protein
MPFCPKCHYEYIFGIGECPDCGVRLVEKLDEETPEEEESIESEEEESTEGIVEESSQSKKEESAQSTNESLITSLNFAPLKALPSRSHAQMFRETLDHEWIPSVLHGATIWVPKEDLEKAQEIADQMFYNI